MTPDLPPVQAVSYVQLRMTAGESTPTVGAVRRFRVNLSTAPTQSERWLVQLFTKENNASPTDGRLWLHDVTWKRQQPTGTLTVGQFRPPFSLQRLLTDRELVTPDRSLAADKLSPSGALRESFGRDLGAQWEPRARPGWTLALGAFRGKGALQQSGTLPSSPLLAVRATQGTSALHWGASLAAHPHDTRTELDLSLQRGSWRSTVEAIRAPHAQGGYLDILHRLTPSTEVVAELQSFDPNTAVRDVNDTYGVTLGLTVVPKAQRDRWQLAYALRRERKSELKNDLVQLQLQHFLTR